MKRFFIIVLTVTCSLSVFSKELSDPVVMTVGGRDIPLSEFLFLAQKDNSVDLLDRASLENYVTLFKNFKLKVTEAEDLGLDKTRAFEDELTEYKGQLRASYLSDKESETRVLMEMYEKYRELVSVSHILFPLYPPTVSKDTVAVYARAKAVYDRLQGGADFDEIAKELTSADSSDVRYETIEYFYPLQSLKAFEDAVYALPVGVISAPVRTARGFHVIRVNKKFPNPGKIQVAHILIARPADAPALMEGEEDPALLERARELYEKAKSGEDFEELAKSYSADERTSYLGGVLPYFGLGEMVRPFQTASFALEDIGDISEPVRTRFGYHIIKLLGKKELAPYEELERNMYLTMKSNERNFDLYRGFDEREKRRYGYIFYQESYDELQRLCDDYFPTDTAFYNRASQLQKPLMHLNGIDFPQSEFAEYLRQYPFSTKTYSGDFLREVYGLFIRDIVTELGRRGLEVEHPEFQQLVKEYHDGILLFEVSNRRVWEQPLEDQARLESEWIAELTAKYPVEINWKLLKKLKKYIPVSSSK